MGMSWCKKEQSREDDGKAEESISHTICQKYERWIRNQEIEGMVMKNLDGMLNLSRTRGQDSSWMFKVRRSSNSYRF